MVKVHKISEFLFIEGRVEAGDLGSSQPMIGSFNDDGKFRNHCNVVVPIYVDQAVLDELSKIEGITYRIDKLSHGRECGVISMMFEKEFHVVYTGCRNDQLKARRAAEAMKTVMAYVRDGLDADVAAKKEANAKRINDLIEESNNSFMDSLYHAYAEGVYEDPAIDGLQKEVEAKRAEIDDLLARIDILKKTELVKTFCGMNDVPGTVREALLGRVEKIGLTPRRRGGFGIAALRVMPG